MLRPLSSAPLSPLMFTTAVWRSGWLLQPVICECTINMRSHTLLQSIIARILERGNMSGNAASSSCTLRHLNAAPRVPWHQ
ncbi:hypothetical protein KCU61_g513, partial [Aureobasidium melanogenum]